MRGAVAFLDGVTGFYLWRKPSVFSDVDVEALETRQLFDQEGGCFSNDRQMCSSQDQNDEQAYA